jgi:4-amino-4-deoxy-L-arabinose transferase-like glycosyltransferase
MVANPDSSPVAAQLSAKREVRHRPGTRSRTAGVKAGWVLLLGFTLLYGAVSLVYPFGRDQATYAFMGDAILHGMTLYRDVPWGLPPMTALVHAFAFVLFGRNMTSIRILDLLWTLATVGGLSLFVTKAFRRPWLGVIAGLLYSLIYYGIDFWDTAQVDGFLNLPLVLSMYLLAWTLTRGNSGKHPSSSRMWASYGVLFVAGFLMGVALLFKYTMGLLLPGAALAVALASDRRPAEGWRAAAWFCGGSLAAGLAALLAIYGSGALPAFIELEVHGILPYSRLAYHVSDAVLPICLLGIPGLIAALVILLAKRRQWTPSPVLGAALILAWLAAALASLLAQGKFFIPYHYLPVLPPLAVFGACALAVAFRPLARSLVSTWRMVALLTIALAGLALAADYPARLAVLARVASHRVSLADLWSQGSFSRGKYLVSEDLALARYLKERTRPEERVANFGIDPPATFPDWREPVLRLTAKTGVDPSLWELPAEFRANPPDIITVKHGERLPWVWAGNRDAYEHLLAFAGLRDFVAERYELEARIGHFDVLRLMDSDSTMPTSAGPCAHLAEDLGEALDWLTAWRAGARDGGADSVRSVLWPGRVPDSLGSVLSAKMVSHKTANRLIWMQQKELDDLLPALSVWIAQDDRPFARQDPFRLQGEGEDYRAGGLSFLVLHRCRNSLVFVYDVRRIPVP